MPDGPAPGREPPDGAATNVLKRRPPSWPRRMARGLVMWWREHEFSLRRAPGRVDAANPPRLPGSIALVPAHRDEATISFCVRSIAPVVDRVVVCLDAPSEPTRTQVASLEAEFPNVSVVWSTPIDATAPAGWTATRNRLVAAGRELFPELVHVLMVDADDVLAWDRVDAVLRPVLAGRASHVRLGICELLGDWFTVARGRTLVYDRNHVYWRTTDVEVHFTNQANGHELIHVVDRTSGREVRARNTSQVLFHGITAKPGDQLLRRKFTRAWLTAGRPGSLDSFIVERAGTLFPLPWPEGLMPSEFLIFRDTRRRDLRPLKGWEHRLPPPVAAELRAAPRFRMDLANRRRSDREPPGELERLVHDQLVAAGRSGGPGGAA